MKHLRQACWLKAGLLAVLLGMACGAGWAQTSDHQKGTPLPLGPNGQPVVVNRRLILKDGSYQVVRQYQIVGDRVRYFSAERAQWEELPADLVDWDATKKWELNHAAPVAGDEVSPAMKEAEAVDREEAAERNEENARMPEVAKGLNLPDEDGVFVLDTYHGTPELVTLLPVLLNMRARTRHGVSTLNPEALSRANLELEGEHAKVHLHVDDPVFYFSLDVPEEQEPVLTNPMTVNTEGEKPAADQTHGAHSAESKFALVQLDERNTVRLVGALTVNANGGAIQGDDVIPAKVEMMPGKRWLRLAPQRKLLIGEYALVEIISPTEVNQWVWDFRVDPATGDNPGSLGPILDQQ
jgi:hypothetical protein